MTTQTSAAIIVAVVFVLAWLAFNGTSLASIWRTIDVSRTLFWHRPPECEHRFNVGHLQLCTNMCEYTSPVSCIHEIVCKIVLRVAPIKFIGIFRYLHYTVGLPNTAIIRNIGISIAWYVMSCSKHVEREWIDAGSAQTHSIFVHSFSVRVNTSV